MILAVATIAFAAAAVADASTSSLAGVALGVPAQALVAAHHGVPVKTAWGPTWSWNAPGVGTVRVTADDEGNVAIVAAQIVPVTGTIDLPAARGFAIASSHDAYSTASTYLESDNCTTSAGPVRCYAYTIDDGSDVLLSFAAQGGGPLREVMWGDRALLKQLGLITPGTSL